MWRYLHQQNHNVARGRDLAQLTKGKLPPVVSVFLKNQGRIRLPDFGVIFLIRFWGRQSVKEKIFEGVRPRKFVSGDCNKCFA